MSSEKPRIKEMHIVSHTHWDREWYQDFQTYRFRLVHLIDELLAKLDSDLAYQHFMMDGQTIVIDDYLEIRPEEKDRLLAHIKTGRIAVGPWYVMPDEFLVSGESLIRNLQIGFRKSREMGVEPMKSGYVTDIFGHNSQFPQILRGFEIDNAVLFRGFRGQADPSEIWWEAADGSRVLGLKLDEDRSYGDFYFFLRYPFLERDFVYEEDELVRRAVDMLAYKAERATTELILGLDGVDHVEIEPQLPWMLQILNASNQLDGVHFKHSKLEDYLQALRGQIGDLQVYKGQLTATGFSGVNGWTPRNVLSSRIHLKQHNQRCELLLEKWAEPWGCFASLEGLPYPGGFMRNAWELLIQNHPHDSICGCSIDQVHRDMIYRFDQSRMIAERMVKEELDYIVNHLNAEQLDGRASFTVFNAAQTSIDGVIETEIHLPQGSDAATTKKHLGGTSFRLLNAAGEDIPYQLLEVKPDRSKLWRPYRDIPRVDKVDHYRIAFKAKVGAFGYATYLLEPYEIKDPEYGEYRGKLMVAPIRLKGTMKVSGNVWDNGAVRLSIHSNGTLQIEDNLTKRTFIGLLGFEDEADIGDGWTYIAPVSNETFHSSGCQAIISVVSDGPLLTRLRVHLELLLPDGVVDKETRRSERLSKVQVITDITLRLNDPVIRCVTTIENTVRDHRLRLLFPTGLITDTFLASTPFDLVKHSVIRPDETDHYELAADIVPYNGIIAVDDGKEGIAVYTKGLYEAAVRDDGERTIALTLFRSTSKEVGTDGGDGGQMLGKLEFQYALRLFGCDNHTESDLWKEHQSFVAGLQTVNRKAGRVYHETAYRRLNNLPSNHSYLNVSTPALRVSAIKAAERCPGDYIIRVWNCTEELVSGELVFGQQLLAVRRINLDEQHQEDLPIQGKVVSIQARPKQIMTLQLTFRQ
ncbi:alpha-mannosidase [Paenibacillus psychroresistens]|nr:glycoside hydrolase family 38 C-terminal domain-containing protein [Paenibacillus psychroresistens]